MEVHKFSSPDHVYKRLRSVNRQIILATTSIIILNLAFLILHTGIEVWEIYDMEAA
jgi:hypothetical protein